MICDGTTKSFGAISSRSEPTAEKARMVRTPRCFSAAMLAVDGTCDGEIECVRPWRARNATSVPESVRAMLIGDDGKPQGCVRIGTYRLGAHGIDDLDTLQLVQAGSTDHAHKDGRAVPLCFRIRSRHVR